MKLNNCLDVEIEKSLKENNFTLKVKNPENKKWNYLHSRYTPSKDGIDIAKGIPKNVQAIIVLGLGLGYHIKNIITKYKNIEIIVIEYNQCIFKAYEKYGVDLDTTNIYISPDEKKLQEIVRKLKGKEVILIKHKPSYYLYKDYYQSIELELKVLFEKEDVNIATLTRFQKQYGKNIIENFMTIEYFRPIKLLFNAYKNIPCLIAGAGPSLEEKLKELKHNKAQGAILISVDTSLSFLYENAIYPHFVITVDPQIINGMYFLYKGIDFSKTYLVADLSTNYLVYRNNFRGIFLFDTPFYKETDFGNLEYGGSVFTNALSLAIKMGCNPVIFYGLDLGFYKNKTHIRETLSYKNMLYSSNKMDPLINQIIRRIHYLPYGYFPSIKRENIKTNKKFLIFKEWIENKIKDTPNIEFINVSYGLYILGAKNLISYNLKKSNFSENMIEEKIDKLPLQKLMFKDIYKKLLKEVQKIKENSMNAIQYILDYRQSKIPNFNKLNILLSENEKELLKNKTALIFISPFIQKEIELLKSSKIEEKKDFIKRIFTFYKALYKTSTFIEVKLKNFSEREKNVHRIS